MGVGLKLKKRKAKTNPSAAAKKVWSLAGDDEGFGAFGGSGDNDMLDDEKDLLEEDDLIKPTAESLARDDCEVDKGGKRKACKDCTCGRADGAMDDEEDEAAAAEPKAVVSSCGSCGLGDAFRCSTCPYLGMPAFAPGEKVSLSARQLNADA